MTRGGAGEGVIETLVLLVSYRVVATPTDCRLLTEPASMTKGGGRSANKVNPRYITFW